MNLLETVGDYRGLNRLPAEALPTLCDEIRQKILEVVLENGGHLASSLGAVELIVALLRIFNPDRDQIVFDVGHQAYAYKILTGRLESFSTLRQWEGISGFPTRKESPLDVFGAGHSSTSISAALGLAKARDFEHKTHEVIAVIGDGALLNGLALEALNNIKTMGSKITIILNDNEMSISHSIGGLSEHLARLSVHPAYQKMKNFLKEQCRSMQRGQSFEAALSRVKAQIKSLLLPPNMFEELGVNYWGPFNGHDVRELEEIFRLSKRHEKPLLIHVITQKGKGYPPAEEEPERFHGIAPSGSRSKSRVKDWSSAATEVLEEIAQEEKKIVCCTAAMKEGTKLTHFSEKYPDRFFDVGIAEEHMLTFAAGLAAGGMKPVVFIYSTFLQRAMDQLLHDIALQNLPVLLAVDRAGLVGEDGATHHGLLDIAWGRSIPNLTLAAPRDQVDLRKLFRFWLEHPCPMMIRYPRGPAPAFLQRTNGTSFLSDAGAELLENGKDFCFFGYGSTVKLLLDARSLCVKRGMASPTVVDLRFAKPIDWERIDPFLCHAKEIVVAEEGYLAGGVGEALAARCHEQGYLCRIHLFGVPDAYIPHGTRAEQWEFCRLTPDHIVEALNESLCKTPR